MGFWKDIKKEWTWTHFVNSWPDYVAVFIAAFVASEWREPIWKYFIAWLITFFVSRFVILSIFKLIKRL